MDSIKSTANRIITVTLGLVVVIELCKELIPLPPETIKLLLFACLFFFIIAGLLYLIWGAGKAWGSVGRETKFRRMRSNQIDETIRLSKRLFPVTTSRRELKRIYKVNNNVCQLQLRETKFLGLSWSNYVGLCSISPMTAEAQKLLEREHLEEIRMTSQHIAKTKGKHPCLYIGGVGALDRRAKADILLFLRGVLDSEFDAGVEVVYTRPSTKDGLRIAKKFGFTPVSDGAGEKELDRIYKLTRTAFDDLR